MVKELEDAPRDEIAVILDADASAVGRGQLRRPGARRRLDPARARVARPAGGARRQLGGAAERPGHRRSTATGSRRSAILAEAEPDGTRPVVELLVARGRAGLAGASRPVVITARLSGALATKLVQRSLAGQGVSVVWVDTRELRWAGRRRSSRSCCGSRRRASPSPSSGAATRSPPCSARRPRPGARMARTAAVYVLPGAR